MRIATKHNSYLDAVNACLAHHQSEGQVFLTKQMSPGADDAALVNRALLEVPRSSVSESIAYTFTGWAAGDPEIIAIEVEVGDAHAGFVLAHYSPEGTLYHCVSVI